jgi:hypothetical protein
VSKCARRATASAAATPSAAANIAISTRTSGAAEPHPPRGNTSAAGHAAISPAPLKVTQSVQRKTKKVKKTGNAIAKNKTKRKKKKKRQDESSQSNNKIKNKTRGNPRPHLRPGTAACRPRRGRGEPRELHQPRELRQRHQQPVPPRPGGKHGGPGEHGAWATQTTQNVQRESKADALSVSAHEPIYDTWISSTFFY